MTTRNVFDRATEFCDELERRGVALGLDGRQAIRDLARQVALDAAAACDQRALSGLGASRGEAVKCAATIRHAALCRPGEVVCLVCDGAGCPGCRFRGVRETGVQP